MKKKITLMLLLLGMGATSAWAQYTFNLQVRANDGTALTGNINLTVAETSTETGLRTRTLTSTRTRNVRQTQTRPNAQGNWSNPGTYSGDGDTNTGNWSTWGAAATGTWSDYSQWETTGVGASTLTFGTALTSGSNATPGTPGTTTTDSEYQITVPSTYSNAGGWTTNGNTRYRTVTETQTRTAVRTQPGATRTNTTTAVEWYFEPVPYSTDGPNTTLEPGWYYIRNTSTGSYLRMNGTTLETTFAHTNIDDYKWRLIKVTSGATADEDNLNFKLVSKVGFSEGTAGGTLIQRNGGGGTTAVSGSTDYTAINSIFFFRATGTAATVIVKNDDQEIVSNKVAVSGTTLSPDDLTYGSNMVWVHADRNQTLNAAQMTAWDQTGGDIYTYYPLTPIAYIHTEGGTRTIYNAYASGLEEGDGYYFTRLTNGNTLTQNLNTYTATTTTLLRFTVWLRGITDATGLTANADGYCKVGTATFTYTDATTTVIDLVVPLLTGINTFANRNNPDAWYYYSNVLDNTDHGGKRIVSVSVTAALDVAGDADLDVDNMHVELYTQAADATFIYKASGSTQQARQDVPQYEHILYVNQLPSSIFNLTSPLTTSTNNFYYYRWYKRTSDGKETYPVQVPSMYDTEAAVTTRNLLSGIVNFSAAANPGYITRGYRANFEIPSRETASDFFTSTDAVVYCDMSHYRDFTWTAGTTTLIEPTVSLRNVFRFRDANVLAKEINTALANGSVLEYYDIEAPAGVGAGAANASRLRLTPKQDIQAPKNYWTYSNNDANGDGATLYASNTFTWYQITNVEDLYQTGAGASVTPLADRKYLQITTTDKTGVEYYAVDASTSGQAGTAKRVAVFKVTYKPKNDAGDVKGVGPMALNPNPTNTGKKDIFEHIDNKKLIIQKTFDQMGTYDTPPITPVTGFPYPPDEVTLYGMGVKPLPSDETSYGFANPLTFNLTGTTADTKRGNHGHHPSPWWSEYGFPSQIYGNETGTNWSGSWWNGPAEVNDITYLKTQGTPVEARGNMLYVDAAQLPGTFATLNFNESFCAGAKLYFSAWIVNLNVDSNTSDDNAVGVATRPNLVMVLKTISLDENNKKVETEIKRFYTGDIGYGNVNTWFQVGFEFTIPETLTDNTDVDFRLEIQNNGLGTTGNDFALDEICVYRTNPVISAVRTNSIFCLPETGSMEVEEDIEMKTEVNLTQFFQWDTTDEPGVGGNLSNIYFRFLDSRGVTFPRYQEEGCLDSNDSPGAGCTSMYPNSTFYLYNAGDIPGQPAGYYYFGGIDLMEFDEDYVMGGDQIEDNVSGLSTVKYSNTPAYKGFYTYRNSAGELVLVFRQSIPAAVLNSGEGGEFNVGEYSVYVGESGGALLMPGCAGESSFTVKFDATDFEIFVGSTSLGSSGVLDICTNGSVDIKAYATDPMTIDEESPTLLFSYYDWYAGPQYTMPAGDTYNARSFTWDIAGNYGVGDPTQDGPPVVKTLFPKGADGIVGAPIRNMDGFNNWLGLQEDGSYTNPWTKDDATDGPAWTWGTPNYIGLNQYGGYFRYTKPTEEVDAVTSATIIGSSDNNDTNTPTMGNRVVEFRTLRNDLRAYRFFFPYDPTARPIAQAISAWPINPEEVINRGGSINYTTGQYFDGPNLTGNEITQAEAGDDYRFTIADYVASKNCDYRTDYLGRYVDIDGEVLDDQTASNIANRVPYIQDLADLERLLSRIYYYVEHNLIRLYLDRTEKSVASLASTYVTVVPIDKAFTVADLSILTEEEMNTAQEICTTPAQIIMKAESWSPDAWFGQVNDKGTAAMPYLDIDDSEIPGYEYVYTVRLPERKPLTVSVEPEVTIQTRATQAVFPLGFLDEIKTARLMPMKVTSETGVVTELSASTEALAESYIGLINPKDPNKLLTDAEISFTHRYAPGATEVIDGETVVTDREELTTSQNVNIRWKLTDNRGDFMALESYPLVHNSYNYFFVDPDPTNDLVNEGEPLPVTVAQDVLEVETNKVALEILASNPQLRSYVDTDGTEYYFRPGYTYDFVFEATGKVEWGIDDKCDLHVPIRLKVVPDTIIWGATAHEWNLDYNWFIPTKVNDRYTDQPSAMKTFPPLPETKVIIPAGLANYSILEAYPNLVAELLVAQNQDKVPTGYDTSKKIISFELDQLEYHPEAYLQKNDADVRTTRFIEFDYNYVPNSADTIHFLHGGELQANAELANQYLLNYNAAKVDLNLNTNRNYGVAAPLRQMYSGDYAFARANPLVSMQLYNALSPQSKIPATDWTHKFNTANVLLNPGQGYSVLVGMREYKPTAFQDEPDDGIKATITSDDYTTLANKTFTFPGSLFEFTYYNAINKSVMSTGHDVIAPNGRDWKYRFIYEITEDGKSVVPLTDTNPDVLFEIDPFSDKHDNTSREVVIGNSLMSHLDFEQFYKDNITLISPQYKLLMAGNQYVTFKTTATDGDGNFTSTETTYPGVAGEDLSKYIAPMQTFIVSLLAPPASGGILKVKTGVSAVNTTSKLRNNQLGTGLEIYAQHGDYISKALVLLDEGSDNAYNVVEDSRVLLTGATGVVPKVSTIIDGEYLDINQMREMPSRLPLAVFTTSKGQTTIRLRNLESVRSDDYDLYFIDNEINRRVLLKNDEYDYAFQNEEGNLIGRFEILRISKSPTGIDENLLITVYQSDNMLHINSINGSNLEKVRIMNASGQAIYQNNSVGSPSLSIIVSERPPAFVIVNAITEKTSKTVKVLLK